MTILSNPAPSQLAHYFQSTFQHHDYFSLPIHFLSSPFANILCQSRIYICLAQHHIPGHRGTGMGRDFWTPCTRAIVNRGPFGNETYHPRLFQRPYPKHSLCNIFLTTSCLDPFDSILQSYWSHKGPFTLKHFRDALSPKWML